MNVGVPKINLFRHFTLLVFRRVFFFCLRATEFTILMSASTVGRNFLSVAYLSNL
jgi:hypothetical protein